MCFLDMLVLGEWGRFQFSQIQLDPLCQAGTIHLLGLKARLGNFFRRALNSRTETGMWPDSMLSTPPVYLSASEITGLVSTSPQSLLEKAC